MNILLIGSTLNYNLEQYVQIALTRLGHLVQFYGIYNQIHSEVIRDFLRITGSRSATLRSTMRPLGIDKINGRLKETASKLSPDVVISIKGELILPETIEWLKEEMGAKTVLWYPDDPRYFKSLVKHIAPAYDHVFSVSDECLQMYRNLGLKNVHHLPVGCEPSIHKKVVLTNEEKRAYGSDICFVGTYIRGRAKILKGLSNYRLMVRGKFWAFSGIKAGAGIYGPELVKAFNAAKVVLNIHHPTDLEWAKINMRMFEATGCGSFLLTDEPKKLANYFRPDVEVVTYKDTREAVDKVAYYLENEDERSAIAERGQKKCYSEHTYEQRVKLLLSKL